MIDEGLSAETERPGNVRIVPPLSLELIDARVERGPIESDPFRQN
jgi:hypothetical protein